MTAKEQPPGCDPGGLEDTTPAGRESAFIVAPATDGGPLTEDWLRSHGYLLAATRAPRRCARHGSGSTGCCTVLPRDRRPRRDGFCTRCQQPADWCECAPPGWDISPANKANKAKKAGDDWPVMDPAAYRGLAGNVVTDTAAHTEADPVAVLLTFLARQAATSPTGTAVSATRTCGSVTWSTPRRYGR